MNDEQKQAIYDAIWNYYDAVVNYKAKPSIYMERLAQAFPEIAKKAKPKKSKNL